MQRFVRSPSPRPAQTALVDEAVRGACLSCGCGARLVISNWSHTVSETWVGGWLGGEVGEAVTAVAPLLAWLWFFFFPFFSVTDL